MLLLSVAGAPLAAAGEGDSVVIWAGAVSAVAAVATAAVAVWALAASASDSRARTRPTLLALFERGPEASRTIAFVVKNVGPTSAEDVRIEFDPPLPPVPEGGPAALNHYIALRYADAISSLGPGQALSNIWRAAGDRDGEPDVLPLDITVTARYRGRKSRPLFTESFVISAKPLTLETYVGNQDDSVKGRLKAVRDEVRKVAAAAEKIAVELQRRR